MKLDLTIMPKGKTYENTYGKYMDILRDAALGKIKIIKNPPYSWTPLLNYMGCDVVGGQQYFKYDFLFIGWTDIDREMVEISSVSRPELVDALWKYDMEWHTKNQTEEEEEHLITNNGSFHRKPIADFMKSVEGYKSKVKNAVVVPCAADKPYPSPMHQAVIDTCKKAGLKDFELIVASGVVGLAPQPLWDNLPIYDSGLPNRWRLMESTMGFDWSMYDNVFIYCDFYNQAILDGMRLHNAVESTTTEIYFVNPITFYYNYLPLGEEHYLSKLRKMIKESLETI